MFTTSEAASLIKATVSSLPCGLCPSCGTAQGHVYDSGTVGLCDNCIDVLLGVAELPSRAVVRLRDDSDDIDAAAEDNEAINLSEDEGDDDAQPDTLAASPSHEALTTIDLHTTDGFEICEHCGAATKHHCSEGHVVCLGCMAAHSGCPLCIEAEGGEEDLSYLDC